jgi:hypothetical protein
MSEIITRKPGFGLILFTIGLLIIGGCSKKITNTDSGDIPVEVSTKLSSGMEGSGLTLFLLTVTGPDIDRPIEDTMTIEDHYLIARVEVPAGKSRTFRIEAYDDTMRLIYVGVTSADVMRNVELNLDIILKPYVPLIKILPRFKSIHQNSQIALELQVYNIRDLNSIDLTLQYYNPTNFNFYIDSIVPNTVLNSYIKLDTFPPDTLQPNLLSFRIYDSGSPSAQGIVNGDGFARLALIYVTSYTTENMYDTVSLSVEATAMSNTAGNAIAADIYYEGCTIEYFEPFYFQVAYWAMDYDYVDTMYDWGQNNLKGIGHGTTLADGYYGLARYFADSDYVEVPYNKLLDINTEISIDMWVQFNFTEGDGTILSKMGSNGEINYQIRCIAGATLPDAILSFEFAGNTINAYQVSAGLLDNQWHYIVLSFVFGDPASIYWMVDGLVVAGGQWVSGDGYLIPSVNTGNLEIGRQIWPEPHYFHGGLDEIRIYSKALDPTFFTRPIGR